MNRIKRSIIDFFLIARGWFGYDISATLDTIDARRSHKQVAPESYSSAAFWAAGVAGCVLVGCFIFFLISYLD